MIKDSFKVLGLIAFFAVSISAIGWVLKPIDKMVDRVVVKSSHQYKEGMSQQAAIFESQLIELNELLRSESDGEVRENLLSQKRIISARLTAITINK